MWHNVFIGTTLHGGYSSVHGQHGQRHCSAVGSPPLPPSLRQMSTGHRHPPHQNMVCIEGVYRWDVTHLHLPSPEKWTILEPVLYWSPNQNPPTRFSGIASIAHLAIQSKSAYPIKSFSSITSSTPWSTNRPKRRRRDISSDPSRPPSSSSRPLSTGSKLACKSVDRQAIWRENGIVIWYSLVQPTILSN